MSHAPEDTALAGLRVVVTRAARQAGDLSERLEALGAEIIRLPAIEIEPLSSRLLDMALQRLGAFDWIVLTSVNGVDVLLHRLRELDVTIDAVAGPKVAAIGDATARRLTDGGITVDLMPERAVAESLLEALVTRGVAGQRLLLPVAEGARDVLPDGLRASGAAVEVVATYRTVRPSAEADAAVAAIRDGAVDVLTFASPSAMRNTIQMIGLPLARGVTVACIGPVTARAARDLGLHVEVEATEHSISGLVEAIVAWAASRTTQKERSDVAD